MGHRGSLGRKGACRTGSDPAGAGQRRLVDLLNPGQHFETDGKARLRPLWPCWARVMEVQISSQ